MAISGDHVGSVLAALPVLRSATQVVRKAFLENAAIVTLPPNEYICMEGDRCGNLPFVLEGTARVYKIGESGREITLYRVEPGESCILTASCILSENQFPAFAQTEVETRAALVPTRIFQTWYEREPHWRSYVVGLLSQRLASVVELVEEVAFRRVDSRIAAHLIEQSVTNPRIETTHEGIAAHLGTSREVVSRILKELEREGAVSLGRGWIIIRVPGMLKQMALRSSSFPV